MSEPKRSAMRVADSDRENVARLLYEAMGAGRITAGELETRLDAVYAAKTFAEFEPVVADLSPGGALALSHAVGEERGGRRSFAVMSATTRRFGGPLPSKHVSRAFWGSVRLDLRRARITGSCTIRAVAVMGAVKIVVPEDFALDVRGIGLMGGFGTGRRTGRRSPEAGAPVLRVTGFAWWGSVRVIRKPLEPRRRSLRGRG
ncbi:DUF1707 SHOCT-like domain-containing protein [Amycolatopsis keratiniphila]|uniref:DUF1707 SHOCT-like domain-containing protein n=1 Tax=Amycolatopsis keratiniphila TaxID=129921 RepID=UPI00087A6311|nr:DUF1707 domain-containing protein [Amycolatopsis keratiniphila]OLZ46783.1 hypothetical protein BS330_37140 [Amycolatopsis keratiniphila subsp. nogabecina]SDU39804.1 protein of unknown function [Amycolatopsis keratiniphila]